MPNIDPDAFMLDRVFQPLVDRLGVDPDPLAKTVFRMHVIGMVAGMGALWTSAMPTLQLTGSSPWLPALMAVPMLLNTAQIGWQLRWPQAACLRPVCRVQRMLWMLMIVVLLWMTIHMVMTNAGMLAKIGMMVEAAAWTMAVSALYLHLCRRPPPRRDPVKSASSRLRPARA